MTHEDRIPTTRIPDRCSVQTPPQVQEQPCPHGVTFLEGAPQPQDHKTSS